ncbi:glycosyltransferase [Pseudomonas sp. ABC1]|uniref:glycosyltransferase n=1 Tax=Pseudomonas sp. ABC1 TaxID=2748080 RepID=UPI00211A06BD|nr:glycosyltransferase [Pseudomonas sp. ABC1]
MPQASKEPLVTVIIASYNHAAYIEQSIESVLAQSYPYVELLVIDDGSTDDSVERIRQLQSRHDFDFRVQSNQGLSCTLNEALARARGDFIAPFGSDDIMRPDRLKRQVAYLQDKPEVGICAGNVRNIDAHGMPMARQSLHPARRLDFEDVFLNRKAGAPAPTLLFRREALETVGGFDPAIRLEDVYIELKITHHGYSIDVLEDVFADYRMHDFNTYKNYEFMVEAMLATLACFSSHSTYAKARSQYLNSMLLKVAGRNNELAARLLRQLPVSEWNLKTLRALWRLLVRRGKA